MEKIARGFRIALVQFTVGKNKAQNISTALGNIRRAAEQGARLIALPECFNSPYGTKFFPEYAEEIPAGETSQSLAAIAKELRIYLVAGTIPERDPATNRLYNTCTVWSPEGSLLATYRKVHLFDISIPGGITFRESETLSAGDRLAIVEVEGRRIGIGICYDIRFGELARLYRARGVDMLLYPGAFNLTTGPLHWELLARARAADNQVFVGVISPARDATAGYVAWGHSMIVDPWGQVLKEAKEGNEIVLQDIDFSAVEQVRQQIPVSFQRRTDLYDTIEKKVDLYKK